MKEMKTLKFPNQDEPYEIVDAKAREMASVQSDWNQNDESAPDYVKNRTHYTKYEIGEVLPETTLDFSEGNEQPLPVEKLPLIIGEKYVVKWNDTEYECVAQHFEDVDSGMTIGVVIGDLNLMTGGESTGEPFIVLAADPTVVPLIGYSAMVKSLDGSNSATVSIIGNVEAGVHKLDIKYLPEGIPWTEDLSFATPTASIDFSDNNIQPVAFFDIPLIVGNTYTVNWNGTEYECVAQEIVAPAAITGQSSDMSVGVGIGEQGFLTGETITGDPFAFVAIHPHLIEMFGEAYMVVALDGSESATISIKGSQETIHKMDNKYLDIDWLPILKKGDICIEEQELSPDSSMMYDVEWISESVREKILSGDIKTGDMFIVEFDGVRYESGVFIQFDEVTSEGTVLIGNASGISDQYPNTTEPFLIAYLLAQNALIMVDNSVPHTIKVTYPKSDNIIHVNKIPVEFLPDDIGGSLPEGFMDELQASLNAKADKTDLDSKADKVHNHDDIYYTETEINNKLSTKADKVHNHDDIYYTETEINNKLSTKADKTDLVGRNVAGRTYTVDEETVVAGENAEVFNSYYGGNKAIGSYSHAEGQQTTASGENSHAEGSGTIASGLSSHAEGYWTTASSDHSHTEGSYTIASSTDQHVQGRCNIEDKYNVYAHIIGNGRRDIETDSQINSNAHTVDWDGNAWFQGDVYVGSTSGTNRDEGSKKLVKENDLQASLELKADKTHEHNISDINNLQASLNKKPGSVATNTRYSFNGKNPTWAGEKAEIFNSTSNIAIGDHSHAEGMGTMTYGGKSHAEGYTTIAYGYASHAEGDLTIAYGDHSHAEGVGSRASLYITGDANTTTYTYSYISSSQFEIKINEIIIYNGIIAKITSIDAINSTLVLDKSLSDEALNDASVSIYSSVAFGSSSHTEGSSTDAFGNSSHAEGLATTASGNYSHAEGNNTTASGSSSHAEGHGTTASGNYSHAEGDNTTASGYASHAEGDNTTASGNYSHAEGSNTTAEKPYSHAEGDSTIASGYVSHAEGYGTVSKSYATHAEGKGTIASRESQHVQGKYNIEDTQSIHIVGNGNDNENRSNAHTLDLNGNAWFQGDVYVGSTSGKNKDKGSVKLQKSITGTPGQFVVIGDDGNVTTKTIGVAEEASF